VADGHGLRRAVPSPRPQQVLGLRSIRVLLDDGAVVICAGGGGIPVVPTGRAGEMSGVEAVIDKDLAASLLARQLGADLLLIATDVRAVALDWGLPTQRDIRAASPDALATLPFAMGTIGPKVAAACEFARATGRPAVIGSLEDIGRLARRDSGTWIDAQADGIRTA
jgi:carbamate kinase